MVEKAYTGIYKYEMTIYARDLPGSVILDVVNPNDLSKTCYLINVLNLIAYFWLQGAHWFAIIISPSNILYWSLWDGLIDSPLW